MPKKVELFCDGNPHDPLWDPDIDGCQKSFIVEIDYLGPICEPCPYCGSLVYVI